MPEINIASIAASQREYFFTGETLEYEFRKTQLQALKTALQKHQKNICQALYADLKKSEFESYATEIGTTIGEIDFAIKNLRIWMAPKRVKTPLFQQIASSHFHYDPYGVTLIISAWNYPVFLLLAPLVAALAAGNTAILKPSEVAPNVSQALCNLITETFDPNYVSIYQGGPEVTQQILTQKLDYIFYTGSTQVGKIIYQEAAKQLTPVTLELGGKSPCIVHHDAALNYTCKRIVWGKFLNGGQTCIAPDYVIVHETIKDKFLAQLKITLDEFYTQNAAQSQHYTHIINKKHFDRLTPYLSQGTIFYGGQTNPQTLYIQPTIITNAPANSPILTDEIFGPILPIITYSNENQLAHTLKTQDKPLSFYLFTKSTKVKNLFIQNCSFGGGCINDTVMHAGTPYLSFGGVGSSGIGTYHGHKGFLTFSHEKSILHKSFIIDLPVRYPPYNKIPLSWLQKLMSWFMD